MCSYGSFAKTGGAGAGFLRTEAEQKFNKRPRKLSAKERRMGLSLRPQDVALVTAAKKGQVDTVADILAHLSDDPAHERAPTSVDVVVRTGGRSQTNRPTSALHEAARHGHTDVCRVLLEAGGADPTKTLELGRVLTALHVCTSPDCARLLLEAGAPCYYRQTLKSDSRIPDPSWYHRAQKRPDVADVVDEFKATLMRQRGRRIAARQRLQMVWDRLCGIVVGVKRIRVFQREFLERYYRPEHPTGFAHGAGRRRWELLAGGNHVVIGLSCAAVQLASAEALREAAAEAAAKAKAKAARAKAAEANFLMAVTPSPASPPAVGVRPPSQHDAAHSTAAELPAAGVGVHAARILRRGQENNQVAANLARPHERPVCCAGVATVARTVAHCTAHQLASQKLAQLKESLLNRLYTQ